jgi:bifunctional UDP-N-acetylglucosamine pyrophosphorylase/glucosamine-1-phosphate N-acetyltransferase
VRRHVTADPARGRVAVVLAGGLGTRMRSDIPKVLHPICGRPMLAYVLDVARTVSARRPVVVTSPATAAVRDAFAEGVDFALQAQPSGTADAVRAGLVALGSDVSEVLILSGDVPLLDEGVVADLADARGRSGAVMAFVSVDTDEPGQLGRVIRDTEGQVQRIVEAKDATAAELEVEEVNAGLYAFDTAWLRARLPDVAPSSASGELYLPELVALARADGLAVTAIEVEDDGTLLGINDRSQLAAAELEMRLRINERHMLAGVTIVDPTTAYIDHAVVLAPDVLIEANVQIKGRTRVGRGTVIRAGSQLEDAIIGERCTVWASVVEHSQVDDEATVGPFSHVRGEAHIGQGVQLGNYAEVKNSRLGRGTKSHHFSYLGDADVGEGVNIGAGTITANYDGRRKHRTTIGDGAFIGSDTVLRAPVSVGEGALTGAGSVVTHDVPPGRVVVGVPARLTDRPAATMTEEAVPSASSDRDRTPRPEPEPGA